MRGMEHRNQFVLEKGQGSDPPIARRGRNECRIDLAAEQRLERAPRGLEDDAHLELRLRAEQLGKCRREPAVTGVALGRDPEQRRGFRFAGHVFLESAKLVEQGTCGAEDSLAGGGRRHSFFGAREERNAEARLELDELAAHRRLREVKGRCGVRNRAALRDGLHETEMADVERMHDA